MSLTGSARAVVQQVDGRRSWTTLRSQLPLSVRPTADGLTLVASAFGPLGGDRTHVAIDVGDGVVLDVGSAGAQVAQPGVDDPVSHAHVELRAGTGAQLSWRPEPVVVTGGAVHRQRLDADLAAGSRAVLVETAVLREGARFAARWRVSYAGVPLLASDLDVGAGAPPGWDGIAVLDGARVVVSALVAGADLPEADLVVPGGEVLRLAGPGLLLTWQGDDAVGAKRAIRDFLESAQPTVSMNFSS